jgi:hypothetical protein
MYLETTLCPFVVTTQAMESLSSENYYFPLYDLFHL